LAPDHAGHLHAVLDELRPVDGEGGDEVQAGDRQKISMPREVSSCACMANIVSSAR
jgi:hypothetical protein